MSLCYASEKLLPSDKDTKKVIESENFLLLQWTRIRIFFALEVIIILMTLNE